MRSMDKNGDTGGADGKNSGGNKTGSSGAHDPSALLDAASLFAYWGRDPAAAAAAAASNPLFSSQFGAAAAAGLGLLPNANSSNDRYSMAAAAAAAGHHHQNTMAVAASQAASLAGLHPASWWSMAQLAAQDYFSRLQASGLSPFPHPDLASAFPQALGLGGVGSTGNTGTNASGNNSRNSSSSNHSSNGAGGGGKGSGKGRKERKQNMNSNMVANSAANMAGLGAGTTITPTTMTSSPSSSYKTNSSYSKSASLQSSLSNNPSSLSAYNHANLHKELLAMQAAASAASAAVSSSKKSHQQQSHHSNISSSGSGGGTGSSGGSVSSKSSMSHHHSASNHSHSPMMTSNSGGSKDRGGLDKTNPSASLNALTSLSQLGSLGLNSPQGVQAAMNALAANTGKVKDYMPSGILSAALEGNDPSSLLGVRLPPDTEIIKYTSSIVGPKIPGTTNRGRKKTISLDPNPLLAFPGLSPAKRARLEMEYAAAVGQVAAAAAAASSSVASTGSGAMSGSAGGGNSLQQSGGNDRVEVIKLPPTITSNGAYNLSNKSTGKDLDADSSGSLNLTMKNTNNSACMEDNDAPLNLSMKPDNKSNTDYSSTAGANSLQSLSSITAALGSGSGNSCSDRSSGSYKEGRPRNLGRGVSKPKKNTVASLLAQSRAVGLKPMLNTQQLISQGADLEKIRQALSDAQVELSTDSESMAAESGLSESEGEDTQIYNMVELKKPLEVGWKRETIIRGLTKNGQIRGDVYYYAPGGTTKLKNVGQILTYLDKNPSKLTRDNFSFSARAIVGSFLQPAPPPYANDGEYIRMADTDVAKRLEELRIFTRHSLNVEQRIEIARQQQALRDAKKLAKEEMARNKEKARQERNEKLENQRKERELKNQQALEARKKRQEEIERQKQEELLKKQQEKEKKRQEAILAKEQDLIKQKELQYAVEMERERRRQHMALIRQFENRRKFEEREKKKHQMVLDRLIQREKRAAARRRDADILAYIRKPQEDSEITHLKDLPELKRLPGCRLAGQAMADLLMVYEFLHNFGETLGFDMESLPTLQSLHDALANENAIEAEEELLSVMTHLLVCAIEDPGIPNPGRHTTLLGQSLRNADLTNSNISEVLRIYLYAAATGEVRQMSGVTLDREKERRVADHHQYDVDCFTTSTKNHQYYELLHENNTWKLSMCLKDKPFVALNPTKKAEILAHLCNDLLLNKAVLKQIEGSLEQCAQAKREKYLNDMKVRKYKSLHMRKLRMEAYEKAQQQQQERDAAAAAAAAQTELEAAERKDSTDTESGENNNNQESSTPGVEKMEVDESTPQAEPTNDSITNHKEECESETASEKVEESPVKSLETTPVKNVKQEEVATYQNGTVATPELNHLLNKKLHSRDDASTDVGMDEDLSDVESEITTVEEDEDNRMTAEEVQKKLEKLVKSSEQSKELLEKASNQLRATCYGQDRYWRRYWKLPKAGAIFVEAMEAAQTEIFEYNAVLENASKKEAEEDTKNVEEDALEDVKTIDVEPMEEPKEEVIEDSVVNSVNLPSPLPPPPPPPPPPLPPLNSSVDSSTADREDSESMVVESRDVSGVEESEKLNDEVCDSNTVKTEVKKEQDATGDEIIKPPVAIEKWFSILNREMPLTAPEQLNGPEYQKMFSNVTCESQLQIQGNRWDIANNIQYFTVPLENGKVDLHFRNESVLSLSGIDEQVVECTISGEERMSDIKYEDETKDDSFYIKAGRTDLKLDEATGIPMTSLANMSLGNISTYVTCDVPTPLSMTPEEHRMLERIKEFGFPKKLEKNFVPAHLRHGWWRIDTLELVNDVIQALHQRGVRERELRLNLLRSINDALDLSDRCLLQAKEDDDSGPGYVDPDSPTAWNTRVAKRVEMALLEQVEALEDKIASASMQVKHWVLPTRTESEFNLTEIDDITEEDFVSIIPTIRERVAGLEAAIERRYLKPPLGNVSGEVQLAVIVQNQQNQHSTSSTGGSSSMASGSNLCQSLQQNNDSNQHNNGGLSSTATSNSAAESPSSVCSSEKDLGVQENMPKGLITWRDAVARSHTTSQLAMALYVLESCVAWDKSIMKASKDDKNSRNDDESTANCINARLLQNCQFCTSGENEDKLLLCDSCDKGYHTYCFKPKMDNIPEGDWYCFECVNKATNERKCIVCGGLRPAPVGKMVYCELCPRAYHQDCYIPPLLKVPRGKWYCHGCISKAPPPKKRPPKKPKEKADKDSKSHNSSTITPTTPVATPTTPTITTPVALNTSQNDEPVIPLSPALSVASTSFDDHQNSIDVRFGLQPSIVTTPSVTCSLPVVTASSTPVSTPTQIAPRPASPSNSDILETSLDSTSNSQSQAVQSQLQQPQMSSTVSSNSQQHTPLPQCVSPPLQQMQQSYSQEVQSTHQQLNQLQSSSQSLATTPPSNIASSGETKDKEKLKQEKKEKHATKKLIKELAICKTVLSEMELHEDSWPFLLPVNTKQFPTYKKIIKTPMDLSTIRKRIQDLTYKSREDFCVDVRQIFDNCEMFNEDDSPVGKAGHGMRKFFEVRWAELTDKHS